MKVEKINDNQIRCTLTMEDLRERGIKLSELAYGSEKAKKLFNEVVAEAEARFGFQFNGEAIMVEAIPTNNQALVLIISKVENPEELDNRFSRFTPYANGEASEDAEPNIDIFSNNELEQIAPEPEEAVEDSSDNRIENTALGLLKDVMNEITNRLNGDNSKEEKTKEVEVKKAKTNEKKTNVKKVEVYRTLLFPSLDKTAAFSKVVAGSFSGKSDLFKDENNHRYYLVLYLKGAEPQEFNRVCNTACEYATIVDQNSLSFYNEHYKVIVKDDAIGRLTEMM